MSLYFDAGGTDFDNKFEPETNGNGNQDPKIIGPNGLPLRYASRSLGGDAGATGFYRTDGGGDLSTLWAARGSVAYLVNPPSYNGQAFFNAAESVTWGDRLYCDVFLNVYNNGTWQLIGTSTNYITDNVPAYNKAAIYNYSGGRLISQGNWAQNPGGGVGNNYQLETGLASFESGWVDYPTTGGAGINHPGGFRGPSAIQANGMVNAGVFSLNGNVGVGISLNAQGNSGNSSYKDKNSGLSWYNLGTISVTIRSTQNGNIAVNGQVVIRNEIRWQPTTYPTVSNGGGGGTTPPGGGGGCVATGTFLLDGLVDNVVEGQDLLITDPYAEWDSNTVNGRVMYSAPEMQPLVRIETAGGAVLLCSGSAPIPTRDRGLVNAPFLRKEWIAVATRDQIGENGTTFTWDKVVKVDMMGPGMVQKIYVDDRCFWASANGELFILHHNKLPAAGD